MKDRTCRVSVEIGTEAGTKTYSLSPLPSAEVGPQFVVGFRLINRSEKPEPLYLIRIALDGSVFCNCPAFRWEERNGHSPAAPPEQPHPSCKHCEALRAAGVLPVGLLDALRTRTRLLDYAERSLKNRDIEREAACRNVDSLNKRIGDLESQLRAVSERALQLQSALDAQIAATPKRRKTKRMAA